MDLRHDDRARIGYVDVVIAFATFVAFATVAPWIYTLIGMADTVVDPLTSVLLSLIVPLLVISLLLSMGVSARSST